MLKNILRLPRKISVSLAHKLVELLLFSVPVKYKFNYIYRKNLFRGKESCSGVGSNLEQTAVIRRELPLLLHALSVQSFIDAPCGDFHWMQVTDLGVNNYIGIDIVPAVIAKNQKSFGNPSRAFRCCDLIKDDLPQGDIILCRDCLVHLTFEQAKQVLRNFKRSGSKYLLTTTFVSRTSNSELLPADIWRPLNLEIGPFNLGTPLRIINEHCTEQEGQYTDKCLGLWLLNDMNVTWPSSGSA
jgi:hypothetical protein